MLSKKSKERFLVHKGGGVLMAQALNLGTNIYLESLEECYEEDFKDLKERIGNFFNFRHRTYIPAYCCVQPESLFIRKLTLDTPAKARTDGFLDGVLRNDYNIEVAEYIVKALNGTDGREFNPEESLQKELVFCGAKKKDLDLSQSTIIDLGVYPKRLEMGSMVTLGGIMDYAIDSEMPVIVLEVNMNDSHMYIIHKKKLDLIRPVPFGINSMVPLIQKELGLGDEESARQMLFSNTFDFTEKGEVLLDKFLKEIRTSIDYYEVQTGHTLDTFFISSLPDNLDWISKVMYQLVGLKALRIDYSRWAESSGLEVAEGIDLNALEQHWFNLFGILNFRALQQREGL